MKEKSLKNIWSWLKVFEKFDQIVKIRKERYQFWYFSTKLIKTTFQTSHSTHLSSCIGRYAVKTCYVPQCEATPFQEHYDKLGRIDKESLNVQDNYIFVQVNICE